ncbi:hypothetical protein A1704_14085 [Chryseobacterium cucumeris]|nr:hypothetical protein A1704_14085 [Chryseobacterium cucumeris]
MKKNNVKRLVLFFFIPIGMIVAGMWLFKSNHKSVSTHDQASATGSSDSKGSHFKKLYLNK